jgi:SRSO17 transposase
VQAKHQSLHHVVAKAEWDDAALLRAVREQVLPAIEQHGPVRYWMVDDTAFPKRGEHSVGVARQYCGQLGKQDSCQVAVSLSVANDHASLPIAYRLYLPEAWAEDGPRRAKAGVPEGIGFETKTAIALGQLRQAREQGVPVGTVLGDAGYGVDTDFRTGTGALGLSYVLGVQSSTSVWPPGQAPLPAPPYAGRGRPPTRLRRDAEHQPVSAKKLAQGLPGRAWRRVTGARAAKPTSPPASPPCGCARRTAMGSAISPGRRSGCWSSGPKARRSRASTGCPTCRPAPRSRTWSTPPRRAG